MKGKFLQAGQAALLQIFPSPHWRGWMKSEIFNYLPFKGGKVKRKQTLTPLTCVFLEFFLDSADIQ